MRLVIAALAALLVAAAPAAAAPSWRDAGVDVPDTMDLRAVATTPDGATVIAVGTDRISGEAVVYRRAAGSWGRELPLESVPEDPELVGQDPQTGEPIWRVPAPPPQILGNLVDVAVTSATEAWAVGSAPAEGGERAFLLHLGADGWAEVPAPAGMGPLTAVALREDDGLLGDANGKVFRITDGVVAATPLTPAGVTKPPQTPVTDLALTAEGAHVTARPADPYSGFMKAAGQELRQGVAERMPAGLQLLALGAAQGQAVAIDGAGPCAATAPGAAPGLWAHDVSLDIWRRQTPSVSTVGTRWCDLAFDQGVLLVAGDRQTATGRFGAVWRRTGAGTLAIERDFDARALHGVALGGTEDWAVGERGALWRRAEWPPPPPPPPPIDTTESEQQGEAEQTDNHAEPRSAPVEEDAPPQEAPLPAPPAQRITVPLTPKGVVEKPPVGTPPGARPAQRLLVGLKAERRGRRLLLRFRLRARARVVVTALRGTKVLGRLRSRTLRPGARTLVVRFRGNQPPTQLKIVVRPVGGPGATHKEGKGS